MSLALMEFNIIGWLPQRRKYVPVFRKAVAPRTWNRSNFSYLSMRNIFFLLICYDLKTARRNKITIYRITY